MRQGVETWTRPAIERQPGSTPPSSSLSIEIIAAEDHNHPCSRLILLLLLLSSIPLSCRRFPPPCFVNRSSSNQLCFAPFSFVRPIRSGHGPIPEVLDKVNNLIRQGHYIDFDVRVRLVYDLVIDHTLDNVCASPCVSRAAREWTTWYFGLREVLAHHILSREVMSLQVSPLLLQRDDPSTYHHLPQNERFISATGRLGHFALGQRGIAEKATLHLPHSLRGARHPPPAQCRRLGPP
jgi:hypothetical protein